MNIFRGEDIHNFIKHIFDEEHSGIVSGTKHFRCNSPLSPHFIGPSCAAEMRVRSESRSHVSGHINLRDYVNVAFCSIAHNLLCLFLGVEAAHRLAVPFSGKTSNDGFLAFRTDSSEIGIFLYFDAPALVVSKMPVKSVEIVHCHHVDKCLHLFHCIEMTAYVEMRSTVTETRLVVDIDGRKCN